MKHPIVLPLIFSILIWACATLFFVFFGEHLLVPPSHSSFIVLFLLLEGGTALLLLAVFWIYIKIDKNKFAALKLSFIGTMTGLFLDTFSIWNSQSLFLNFSHDQLISFTIWMTCAYSLFLIIPFFLNYKQLRILLKSEA